MKIFVVVFSLFIFLVTYSVGQPVTNSNEIHLVLTWLSILISSLLFLLFIKLGKGHFVQKISLEWKARNIRELVKLPFVLSFFVGVVWLYLWFLVPLATKQFAFEPVRLSVYCVKSVFEKRSGMVNYFQTETSDKTIRIPGFDKICPSRTNPKERKNDSNQYELIGKAWEYGTYLEDIDKI